MKKPAQKPLRLETQTIRSLDGQKLTQVAAGANSATLPLAQSCNKACSGDGIY